jgi:hypothetical protein
VPNSSYSLIEPAVAAFIWIPVLLACAFTAATWSAWRQTGHSPAQSTRAALMAAGAAALWMAATWLLAARGVFQHWDRLPPPFAFLVAAVLLLTLVIGLSPLGTHIAHTMPLWLLVAVQGFRLPLELAMHAMYERGIMPVQMSYSGRNFDIFTGASALVVAALVFLRRGGLRLVFLWNVIGLALVLNVVIVAILGTPVFRMFGDEHLNVWVTFVPFVWLPAVMVLAALAGHLLIFRAVRAHS